MPSEGNHSSLKELTTAAKSASRESSSIQAKASASRFRGTSSRQAGFRNTIRKSQGQTFECVGVDLICEVFSHDQLYVAFSCVRAALKVLLDVDCRRKTLWITAYPKKALKAVRRRRTSFELDLGT
uniref:Uncharacterized protein n=1 Tax=Acrobeloides nanus TaxID=290746 RepID=A0A914CQC9_9BILA